MFENGYVLVYLIISSKDFTVSKIQGKIVTKSGFSFKPS